MLAVAALVAILIGGLAVAWTSAQRGGLRDLMGVPESASSLVEEEGRTVHLNHHIERMHTRLAIRSELTEGLISGRLSLLEAAAWFYDLDRDYPRLIHELRRKRYGTASEEEFACVAVIQAVEDRLESEGLQRRDLVHRLREELAQLRRRGPVKLPLPRRLEQRGAAP
jgi:hypothetical protein